APASPDLKERLQSKTPIKQLEYSDRYIVSPLTASVLSAVLGHLRNTGSITPRTAIIIRTARGRSDLYPSKFFDTWVDVAAQAAVLEGVVATSTGSNVSISMLPKQAVQHQREMRLEFEDGATFCIRLDHGLSFFECRRRHSFDFRASTEAQVQKILGFNDHLQA